MRKKRFSARVIFLLLASLAILVLALAAQPERTQIVTGQSGDISPVDPPVTATPELAVEPAKIPATEPAMREPLFIDLISEPPPEPHGNAAGPNLV